MNDDDFPRTQSIHIPNEHVEEFLASRHAFQTVGYGDINVVGLPGIELSGIAIAVDGKVIGMISGDEPFQCAMPELLAERICILLARYGLEDRPADISELEA